jgi:uncharacterized membrane protein (DUF4010 family)
MEPLTTLGISLGLGLLIGLQRERTDNRLGGIRTFPIVSLFGTLCAWLGGVYGGWVIAAGLLAVFGVGAVYNALAPRLPESDHGQTTEVAALLTFALGAYLVAGDRTVSVVGAGVLVILLHLKEPMHLFVAKMGRPDMTAIMQLVVISLIVLPLLPDRAYGPYGVLNPFDIWRMVVLIVSISLAGYIAYKFVDPKAGTLLGGLLGGLISSTATTVSYARRARLASQSLGLAVLAILAASSVTFVRVMIEVTVVAPAHVGTLLPPIGAMQACMILAAAAAYFSLGAEQEEPPAPANPAELKTALIFAAVYALVLFSVAAVKDHFGGTALYGVAIISGLTDMDAITLSVSRMVTDGRIESVSGWRLILVASLSNIIFKGVVAGLLGGYRLGLRLAIYFGLALAGGLAILWLWPTAGVAG